MYSTHHDGPVLRPSSLDMTELLIDEGIYHLPSFETSSGSGNLTPTRDLSDDAFMNQVRDYYFQEDYGDVPDIRDEVMPEVDLPLDLPGRQFQERPPGEPRRSPQQYYENYRRMKERIHSMLIQYQAEQSHHQQYQFQMLTAAFRCLLEDIDLRMQLRENRVGDRNLRAKFAETRKEVFDFLDQFYHDDSYREQLTSQQTLIMLNFLLRSIDTEMQKHEAEDAVADFGGPQYYH